MTGLEKIVAQIGQDARQNADTMLERARAQAAQILLQAQQDAKEQAAQIEAQAQRQVESAAAAAKSAAALATRRAVLAAKQELISETVEGARRKILSLPSDQYFALLLRIARRASLPREGEVSLCKRDLERIPADFAEALSKAAKGPLTLSEQPCEIDGGFVLNYGGVEENCSIEALFYAARERLQDRVQEILFS